MVLVHLQGFESIPSAWPGFFDIKPMATMSQTKTLKLTFYTVYTHCSLIGISSADPCWREGERVGEDFLRGKRSIRKDGKEAGNRNQGARARKRNKQSNWIKLRVENRTQQKCNEAASGKSKKPAANLGLNGLDPNWAEAGLPFLPGRPAVRRKLLDNHQPNYHVISFHCIISVYISYILITPSSIALLWKPLRIPVV